MLTLRSWRAVRWHWFHADSRWLDQVAPAMPFLQVGVGTATAVPSRASTSALVNTELLEVSRSEEQLTQILRAQVHSRLASQRLHRAADLRWPLHTGFFQKSFMVDCGFDVTHSSCKSCVLIRGTCDRADLVAHASCRCKFEQKSGLWENLCAEELSSAQATSTYRRETPARTQYLTVARLYSKLPDIPHPEHCARNSVSLTALSHTERTGLEARIQGLSCARSHESRGVPWTKCWCRGTGTFQAGSELHRADTQVEIQLEKFCQADAHMVKVRSH